MSNLSPLSLNLEPFFPKIELSSQQDEKAAELWDFPSDHLPVTGQVDGHRFGTFNILNTRFIDIIIDKEKNKGRPGWSNSYLARAQATSSYENPKITEREQQISMIIQNLLFGKDGKLPLDFLCIQECSDLVNAVLKEKFESKNFRIISGNGGQNNDVAIIVNTAVFSIEETLIETAFKRETKSQGLIPDTFRPVVALRLKELNSHSVSARTYWVVTAHISSAGADDEYKIERLKEVKDYLKKTCKGGDIIILTGDLNAEPRLVNSVFSNYKNLSSHYSQIENKSPYYMTLIDHLLVSCQKENIFFTAPLKLIDLPDSQAAEIYQKVFEPILNSSRKTVINFH